MDWSRTFPGIEQPNEAYSPVLNKNVAYEQTKKPRALINNPQPPQYEEIQPGLPKDEPQVISDSTVSGQEREHDYQNTTDILAQTVQKYENVSVPHQPYVNNNVD